MALSFYTVAQTIPESSSITPALVAVVVAIVAIVPSTIAAVGTVKNQRQIEQVRHEVTPTKDGSSSFDLLHRLVWETHEKVSNHEERITFLEHSNPEE